MMDKMKNLITILFVVCSLSISAQNSDDVYYSNDKKTDLNGAPKKAWKIVVKNTLTADENFTLVGQTLAENDFSIDKKDKEFHTIKTGTREINKNGAGTYFLNFSIKQNMISVTGQFKINISLDFGGAIAEDSFSKISNRGMGGSFQKMGFEKMNEFALKLGSDVQYIAD